MLNEISRILHFGENNSLNNNDLFHHVFIHVFRDNSKYISWKYGALFSVCFKVYSLTWRQKAAMGYWSPWEFQHSTWVFEDIWSICGRKLEPVQLKVHRELLILFHIFFFLCCQGMAHVCSPSLLLAWKEMSKLLWQMLALSPLCPARALELGSRTDNRLTGVSTRQAEADGSALNRREGRS